MKTKNIYCIKCNKQRKFENPKKSIIFDKTLVLFIICDKCGSKDKKKLKKKNQLRY